MAATGPPIPLASLPLLADKASLLGMSFGSACLLLLLGLNAWLSKSKKTPWIPGDSLVLGALSLQLLGLVSQPVLHISDQQKLDTDSVDKQFYEINSNQFLIISGRVVTCVFIGNLLPDVARARNRKVWSNLLALSISATVLLVHLSYESYIIVIEYWIDEAPWDYALFLYQLSNMTIFASIVLLVLLLGCAALASKSIQEVVAHRIPVILCPSEYQNTRPVVWWEAVEEHAVRSWIMARTYQPEYIIARSVLSSSIGFLVTLCVLFCSAFSLLGCIKVNSYSFVIPEDGVDWWRGIVLAMEWIFILLGWVLVFWRWFTAVVFYPKRMGKDKEALSLKQYFHVEEFWKNALLELQEEFKEWDIESFQSLSLLKRFLLMFVKKLRLYKFLHILLHLQILLVLMSKTCWLISEMAFSNQYTRRLLMGQAASREFSVLCNMHKEGGLVESRAHVDFIKYSEALMHMPGENPVGVWIANLKSIQEMKAQSIKGESRGRSSKALIFLLEKTPPTTNSLGLFAISPQRKLEVERDFHVGKRSLKMVTVSLLTIIIELSAFYTRDAVEAYLQACWEAWRIMELVDNSDPEAALVSKQADRLFHRLKRSREWLGLILPVNKSDAKTFEAANKALHGLADIGKKTTNDGCVNNTGYDSKNWKAIIAGNNLYKVCESIQNRSNNLEEMLSVIESSLADVVGSCMLKMGEIIMNGCKSWAEAFMEEKLWDAFYEAGRAKGVTRLLGIKLGRPSKYERIHSY